MKIKEIVTTSHEDARSQLLSLGFSKGKVDHIVNHELAHFNKAQELGYKPIYHFGYTNATATQPLFFSFGEVRMDRIPEPMDLIDICLAPARPSIGDLNMTREAWKQLEGDLI